MTAEVFERAKEFVAEREREAFELLKELVLINSWSYNKSGVDRVAERIASVFPDDLFEKHFVEQEELGNHLVVRTEGCAKEGFVLMVGHMDTVFRPDEGFSCFDDRGDVVIGPGVIDMKGGLVIGIYSLLFACSMGNPGRGVAFVFNSDEEIGSPTSRRLIMEEARKASCGLVFECGGSGNTVVTSRRGKIGIRVNIRGESGHAGFAGKDKKSALLEMAHKIIRFEAMNGSFDGVSCNVGKAYGGKAPNVVPDSAYMEVDLRYKNAGDKGVIMDVIKDIVDTSEVSGVEADFKVVSERPPMERTEKTVILFESLKELALRFGMSVGEEMRTGVSDANLISSVGIPVLDGLGPIGDNDHTHNEYMLKSSFRERMLLSGVFLVSLLEGRN